MPKITFRLDSGSVTRITFLQPILQTIVKLISGDKRPSCQVCSHFIPHLVTRTDDVLRKYAKVQIDKVNIDSLMACRRQQRRLIVLGKGTCALDSEENITASRLCGLPSARRLELPFSRSTSPGMEDKSRRWRGLTEAFASTYSRSLATSDSRLSFWSCASSRIATAEFDVEVGINSSSSHRR